MLAVVLGAALALAQAEAPGEVTDPRIQLVTYDANRVVPLSVNLGYAAVVELGSDERVESVVVGNSSDWQVTASKRGDHIVVKPLSGAATTDMVVITGNRRYVFQLQLGGADGEAPYVVRFDYPDRQPVPLTPETATGTFRFSGAKRLYPIAMRDDGVRTTISWARDAPLPAIFAVDKDDRERIVNGRMDGSDFVVESIAPRFNFRLGRARATAKRLVVVTPK